MRGDDEIVFHFQTSSVLANVELSRWTGDEDIASGDLSKQELETRNHEYLTVYGILGGIQGVCTEGGFFFSIKMKKKWKKILN